MANIKITFNPNGPNCKHVLLLNDSNQILETLTEAALSAPVGASDSVLTIQVKREMVRLGLSTANKVLAKTGLEATTFDLAQTPVLSK